MIDYNTVYNLTKDLNILYCEDDASFQKETSKVFEELFFSVDLVSNGLEGMKRYKEYYKNQNKTYDIVITDINMPHMNGIDVAKEIYTINKKQAIIVISAHDESKYLMELVNIGIEQFLIKPLNFDIFLSVIHDVAYKVVKGKNKNEILKVIKLENNYSWDIEESSLLNQNEVVKLTKKETLLLELFIKNQNKISSYEEIINHLYDDPHLISTDSLKTLISRFRKKIPDQNLESIYGFGYRLVF